MRPVPFRSFVVVLLTVLSGPVLATAIPSIDVFAGQSQTVTLPANGPWLLEAAAPQTVAAVDLPEAASAIARQDGHLLLAAGRHLLVYSDDLPSPEVSPEPDADLALPFSARLLLPQGRHYLLVGEQGLSIVDAGDIRSPRVIGQLAGSGPVTAAAIAGERLYLVGRQGHLRVIDIHRPARPRLVAEGDLGAGVMDIAIAGSYFYVAAAERGVQIYDLRQTDGWRPVAGYVTTGPALALHLRDGLAYVACSDAGVTVLDVADPRQPRWLGSHQQVGSVSGLSGDGERLYVLGDGRLTVIDVSHPAMPSILSAAPLSTPVVDLLPAGDKRLFLLTAQQLRVVDVDVSVPEISNEGLDFGQGVNLGGQRRAVIRAGILYVADWFSGIHIYDVRDRRRPRLLASLHTPGSPKGIVLDGDVAYVADDDHGLQVIDIADPAQPRLIGHLQTPGLAYTPVIVGQRLYLASHRGGIQIIDIGQPTQPRLLSSYDTAGKAWSIRVRGQRAYVADDDNGLLVFDVSDDRAPRLIARYLAGGAVEEVLLDGDEAYLALFEGELQVVDIGGSAGPRLLARLSLPGNARGLERRGRTLYVAAWLAGIHVVDIHDPARPELIASHDTPGAAWGVRLASDTAYVLDWWGGLSLLDVSLPGRPRAIARYPARARVEAVATRGDYAYVAFGDAGLQVFDIRNPLNPTWVGGSEIDGAWQVALGEQQAFVVDRARRLHVVDISDPFSLRRQRRLTLTATPVQMAAFGRWLYWRDSDGRLGRLDADSGHVEALAAGDIYRDLWASDERIVATRETGEVQVLRPAANGDLLLVRQYPGRADIRQARIFGGRAFVLRPGTGYLPLVGKAGEAARPLYADRGGLRDIQADRQGGLYVLTVEGAVIQLDGRRGQWRPVARYRPRVPATAMTLHRGVLYLAGANQLIAVRTLTGLTGGARGRLRLPATMPLGDYRFVTLETPYRVGAQRLQVRRKPYRRPRLSAEALRRLVDERQQGDPGTVSAPPP